MNNLQALQLYLQILTNYNKEVVEIQDGYKAELDTWQQSQEDYKNQLNIVAVCNSILRG